MVLIAAAIRLSIKTKVLRREIGLRRLQQPLNGDHGKALAHVRAALPALVPAHLVPVPVPVHLVLLAVLLLVAGATAYLPLWVAMLKAAME